ncbi:MAG: sulfotransferase [Magnetococcales bacterium]|nr:sulfotransferase [Magnetococcales bacterium]
MRGKKSPPLPRQASSGGRKARAIPELLKKAAHLHAQGQWDQAEGLCRKILKIQRQHPDALHILAALSLARQQLDRALTRIQKAILASPLHPGFHNTLGLIHLKKNALEKARAAFEKELAIAPGNLQAINNLGHLLRRSGLHETAEKLLKNALHHHPGTASLWLNLGQCLKACDRTEEAAQAFTKGIECDPHLPQVHKNLGVCLQHQGQAVEAEAAFRKAWALKRDYGEAIQSLAHVRRFSAADRKDLLAVQRVFNQPQITDATAAHCHFALGKMHDDCGNWSDAFHHYQQANGIRRRQHPFSPEDHHRLVARNIAIFSENYFSGGDFGDPSEQPVFILGAPRSGTSLVEQILASHPQIFGAGELSTLPQLAQKLAPLGDSDHSFPESARDLRSDEAQSLAEAYLARLNRDAPLSALRVIDKLPDNFFHLGLIFKLFPQARVIHCRRRPMDLALSLYFQDFSHRHPYCYDLADIAHFLNANEKLATHWQNIFPDRLLTIHYEDVVADLEGSSKQLVAFLGLQWDAACLTFHQNPRTVATASSWQVRQPLYRHAVERWRNYEAFLAPFRENLAQ